MSYLDGGDRNYVRLLLSGTIAAIPAPAIADRYYWATDNLMLYRDTGAAWEAISHVNLAGVAFDQHHDHYALFLPPLSSLMYPHTHDYDTGTVWLFIYPVPYTITIDRLFCVNSQAAGPNLRLGVYADNGGTPAGGALLCETASFALTGFAKNVEAIIPVSLQLTPGLYWFAFQTDTDATSMRTDDHNISAAGGEPQTKSYALVYGAFTDPCPAVANAFTRFPIMSARVSSTP